jgi:Rrf2 family protein
MLSSSRFAMTVHALCVLAKSGKGPVCSTYIAQSVHTNPVVIRRLMTQLERAQLVKSTAGRSGGFELFGDPRDLTLADIYSVVEDDNVFRMHKADPASKCPVAAQMGKVLAVPLGAAHAAMTNSLRATTLFDVASAILQPTE